MSKSLCVCTHIADLDSGCSATKHEWPHGVLPQPVWGPNEWHGRQHEASVWRPQRHAGGYDAGHGPTSHDAQQLQLRQLWKQQLRQLWHATHDAAAAAPYVWRAGTRGYGPPGSWSAVRSHGAPISFSLTVTCWRVCVLAASASDSKYWALGCR